LRYAKVIFFPLFNSRDGLNFHFDDSGSWLWLMEFKAEDHRSGFQGFVKVTSLSKQEVCVLKIRWSSVEKFTNYILENVPYLDVIINNAAQTIRRFILIGIWTCSPEFPFRPPAYYAHLIPQECSLLPPEVQNLVVNYRYLIASFLPLFFDFVREIKVIRSLLLVWLKKNRVPKRFLFQLRTFTNLQVVSFG
jgi:hypothetical protein